MEERGAPATEGVGASHQPGPSLIERAVEAISEPVDDLPDEPLLLDQEVTDDEKEKAMFSGYKTYIVAAVAIIGAVGAYLSGDSSLGDTIQLVVTAVLGAIVWHGVSASAK